MKINSIEHMDEFGANERVFWVVVGDVHQRFVEAAQRIDQENYCEDSFGVCVGQDEDGWYVCEDMPGSNLYYISNDGDKCWMDYKLTEQEQDEVIEFCKNDIADEQEKLTFVSNRYQPDDPGFDEYDIVSRYKMVTAAEAIDRLFSMEHPRELSFTFDDIDESPAVEPSGLFGMKLIRIFDEEDFVLALGYYGGGSTEVHDIYGTVDNSDDIECVKEYCTQVLQKFMNTWCGVFTPCHKICIEIE